MNECLNSNFQKYLLQRLLLLLLLVEFRVFSFLSKRFLHKLRYGCVCANRCFDLSVICHPVYLVEKHTEC